MCELSEGIIPATNNRLKMKNYITVQSLTDSILSVYGDMSEPALWAQYVMAIQNLFGAHPIGAAHEEEVSAEFAAKWYTAFGI